MSQRPLTKDQRFLIVLYERAMQQGDVYAPFNRYEIGTSIGLQKRATETITRDLMQCNFLKKDGEEFVHLTQHGESLVLELLKR